jgi:hypothetical protein
VGRSHPHPCTPNVSLEFLAELCLHKGVKGLGLLDVMQTPSHWSKLILKGFHYRLERLLLLATKFVMQSVFIRCASAGPYDGGALELAVGAIFSILGAWTSWSTSFGPSTDSEASLMLQVVILFVCLYCSFCVCLFDWLVVCFLFVCLVGWLFVLHWPHHGPVSLAETGNVQLTVFMRPKPAMVINVHICQAPANCMYGVTVHENNVLP